MKTSAIISTILVLAAFPYITSVNSRAENTAKPTPEKDQRVYTLTEVSTRPKTTKYFGPDTSDFNRNLENSAVVSLIVETDGTVGEAKLEQSSNPSFGKAALEAAKKWEFIPGQYEGKAVRTRISIPFKTT